MLRKITKHSGKPKHHQKVVLKIILVVSLVTLNPPGRVCHRELSFFGPGIEFHSSILIILLCRAVGRGCLKWS